MMPREVYMDAARTNHDMAGAQILAIKNEELDKVRINCTFQFVWLYSRHM